MARPEGLNELLDQYGGEEQPAKTYPAGEKPGPALQIERVQPPASAPGPAGQATAAPATAQPGSPQAGAGGNSARDTILQADPKQKIETAENTAKAISSATGKTKVGGKEVEQQKKQINEALKAQGVDPKQAFNKLYEAELDKLERRYETGEITKRQYKGWKNRWKNIFNTVPKEDFGLFMMDFGLRMMANSGQGETLGASIGMAGQGALQGAMARKEGKQQQRMGREQQAFDRALGRAGLAQSTATRPQVESTEAGLIERTATGEWQPIINPETGRPYERKYAADREYRGKEVYVTEQLKDAGYTKDEIAMVQAGGMPRRVMKQELFTRMLEQQDDADYTRKIRVGNQEVRLRDATPTQIRLYTEQLLDELYKSEGRQGALPQ